jgi:hypothetical protein
LPDASDPPSSIEASRVREQKAQDAAL